MLQKGLLSKLKLRARKRPIVGALDESFLQVFVREMLALFGWRFLCFGFRKRAFCFVKAWVSACETQHIRR